MNLGPEGPDGRRLPSSGQLEIDRRNAVLVALEPVVEVGQEGFVDPEVHRDGQRGPGRQSRGQSQRRSRGHRSVQRRQQDCLGGGVDDGEVEFLGRGAGLFR
ncbi:MAG: hypothetical protein HY319_27705 [Armatimonadetes bacterium]|nr:hypothetical protein [Armatimonadota bacterium]